MGLSRERTLEEGRIQGPGIDDRLGCTGVLIKYEGCRGKCASATDTDGTEMTLIVVPILEMRAAYTPPSPRLWLCDGSRDLHVVIVVEGVTHVSP